MWNRSAGGKLRPGEFRGRPAGYTGVMTRRAAAFLFLWAAACRPAEDRPMMKLAPAAIPPIDAAAPATTLTATFALG